MLSHVNPLPSVLVVLALTLAAPGPAAPGPAAPEAPAATVRYLLGQAEAVAVDGSRRALALGGPLHAGERITTDASSFIDLDFADGGRVLLHPSSEFQIESFRPAPAASRIPAAAPAEPEAAFFRLIKGGLRAVTGAISKKDRTRYGVRTPMVTLGVRGTEYELRLCQGDCAGADGVYAGVIHGAIVLTNAGGERRVDAGQYAWVRDAHTRAERLRRRPDALDRATISPEVAHELRSALHQRYDLRGKLGRTQRSVRPRTPKLPVP